MKVITISQPYASLIASGQKWVENRTWPTKHRGPLAIHAGVGTQYMSRKELIDQKLPTGCVIAVCHLAACVNIEWTDEALRDKLPETITVDRFRQHEHSHGPWCWVVTDVRRVSPFYIRGSQGLWTVPGNVERMLK